MRILHCPYDVGGNAWTLSQAERKLGLDSRVIVYQQSWFGYSSDYNLHLERSSTLNKGAKILAFFLKALTQYDVFHFNFGSSLIDNLPCLRWFEMADLALLKAFGKKVIVTFQGCDARQREYCRSHFKISVCAEPDCYGGICTERTDERKRRRIDKIARYADKIFALNPDLLNVLPGNAEFLPYTTVDLNEWLPVNKKQEKKFTIIHSPTNRAAKGTGYIEDAVNRLVKKYAYIELKLVEGIPHHNVKDIYSQADIAIDQLLVGWYGGFAVEMMALGKPVLSYVREEDTKFLPPGMKDEMPIINANPENIYEVLNMLVQERDTLHLLGERSRAYVERWHDAMKIAAQMKAVYESPSSHSRRVGEKT